ncbi:S-adenosyl-L-methionine-dependent methyltransferase [Madurella fahalii]|uniref:S-adenosyl-L-methionine-dependent methyltransferase n=1 Tax=Madurella fahalii TaxID=1157608 RepID=A0ABQ0G4W5_9PEZI
MASVDPKTKTTYATTDWSVYQQGRPAYPPSLTEFILNYHRRHQHGDGNTGSGWDRLVDIGAGSGIASTNFMPSFKTIHISDPSASNLDQARSFLTDYARRHNLDPVLEYSQSTGEEAHTHLTRRQQHADLAICATAAHFIDPDGLAASMAALLRPGGTLAVFSYWMPSFPGRSRRFADAFAAAFDKTVLRALLAKEAGQGGDPSRTRLAGVVRRRMTGSGVLDSLPVPDAAFDDPLRVYINAGDTAAEIPYSELFRKFAPAGEPLSGVSRVAERDRIVRYTTGVDPEAEGWEFEVDKKWLAAFFDTIRPPGVEMSEEAREVYAEWERVFDEECPDGRVRINWPAYLVLASRK